MPPPGGPSTSSSHDVMAAMLRGLRHPEPHFPNFIPPPGFPPPFHPQLPGSEFRPRIPFHGGPPPPFPLLPGGPLDVQGMLPPHLDERGLPMHPDLGLPGMYISLHSCMFVHLLDIPRQPTCMKLGTRELYQPIQSCHVVCLGISNKSVAVPRQDSMSPALQHVLYI